jgi:hypothetical protein
MTKQLTAPQFAIVAKGSPLAARLIAAGKVPGYSVCAQDARSLYTAPIDGEKAAPPELANVPPSLRDEAARVERMALARSIFGASATEPTDGTEQAQIEHATRETERLIAGAAAADGAELAARIFGGAQ